MAIGRISGPMLQTNLDRQGVDLSIETDLLYVDVTNSRIGILTNAPAVELEVAGNIKANNLEVTGNITVGNSTTNSLDTGNIRLADSTISTSNTNGNLTLAPNGTGVISVNSTNIVDLASPVAATDAANKGYIDDLFGNIDITGNSITANNGNLILNDNVSISGNLQVGDVTISGVINGIDLRTGNIAISDNTISSTDTDGNIVLAPNGTGYVTFAGISGFLPPVGGTAARPVSPPTGLTRFNSTSNFLEFYNGSNWVAAGPEAGTITAQAIYGDGSTATFTLEKATSAEAVIVSTNGTMQKPNTAYTVAGDQITFSEAPAEGDTVDVRFITLTYSFNSITLPIYTRVETLALTGMQTGETVYVTDGASGNPCLAVYNGSAWKTILLDGDL
jgi:hypothetical protein